MAKGAPKGNQYAVGRSGNQWRDAIRLALARDKQALVKVAEALIAAAQNGDIPAIKELGDRLDGKSVAIIDAEVTHRDSVARLPAVAQTTEEWQKRYQPPTIQ